MSQHRFYYFDCYGSQDITQKNLLRDVDEYCIALGKGHATNELADLVPGDIECLSKSSLEVGKANLKQKRPHKR